MTSNPDIHVVAPGVAVGPVGTPAEDLAAALVDPNRPSVGRLNGTDAPIGTLVGPDSIGQLFVVIGRDDQGVTVGHARVSERDAMYARAPQSLCEIALQRSAGLMP